MSVVGAVAVVVTVGIVVRVSVVVGSGSPTRRGEGSCVCVWCGWTVCVVGGQIEGV